MIGQLRLKLEVEQIDVKNFPRFTIIVGAKYSGRKRLVTSILRPKLQAQVIRVGTKIAEIREVIDVAYTQSSPVIYLIADADRMSTAAKNALLKVTEEPPRLAYFVMTLESMDNTLQTLKSRSWQIKMAPYSANDLLMYIEHKGLALHGDDLDIALKIANNPGELDLLASYNLQEFYKYVKTVVGNLHTVNPANALKIGMKLKYKDDGDGYDIDFFMRAIQQAYLEELIDLENDYVLGIAYTKAIEITGKYLSELSITGIHKQSTIDAWLLEMWKELTECIYMN